MKYIVICFLIFLMVIPSTGLAQKTDLTAAFVRNGDLWVIHDGKEKKVTHTKTVTSKPIWSHDGQYVAFLQKGVLNEQGELSDELWTYQIKGQKKKKIYSDAFNAKWSPKENKIAFQHEGALSVSDLKNFFNVSVGVGGYTWLPEGNGFLLSSNAMPTPQGWTNAVLYKKMLPEELVDTMDTEAEAFFTIPKQLKTDDAEIPAIGAEDFGFSPSKKWMSFIVYPTASWSMDSNMLSVIRTDGTDFSVVDEIITGVGTPKWAPSEDILAYIGGSGRLVFGFKNKDLKTKEFPASNSLTPESYAELDFTWLTDEQLVTSRVKEADWSNDPANRPKPALYKINLESQKQDQISSPSEQKGDYHPMFLEKEKKLAWLRGNDLIDEHKDVWIAEEYGSKAEKWVENVSEISFYEPEH
ncbi:MULTISPECIES: hypothetical protein [Pontibacillus]|uniref:WD40 repeat protein n=1 Tax=Pontibacillus chungwhensis TaxID=265426 RepID=A0ABY8UZ97_9BACI|nr:MULTISPECIES: hypothetical protein [Pontibacillus]MCD5324866.1 hypothetical protein [Pontibacillus sp. HN14]WIF98827.1 hypothetical protein QNI29_04005 [Pontibacillus chungwhensis]